MAARKIIDDVVMEQRKKKNVSQGEYSSRYDAHVRIELPKVRLEQSTYGLSKQRLTDSLKMNYDYICIPDEGMGEIQLPNGQVVPVENQVVHMMKALLLEQVSTYPEYSKVVAEYFTHLLGIAVYKKPAKFIPKQETPFTCFVAEKLEEFASGRLPEMYGKRDVVVEEEAQS